MERGFSAVKPINYQKKRNRLSIAVIKITADENRAEDYWYQQTRFILLIKILYYVSIQNSINSFKISNSNMFLIYNVLQKRLKHQYIITIYFHCNKNLKKINFQRALSNIFSEKGAVNQINLRTTGLNESWRLA